MGKYGIVIKEILSTCVDIAASSEEEALQKAEELYKNEEIILNYENLEDTDFSVGYELKEDE